MKKLLPIVLGSDENAYGNCRLLTEFCDAKPLMLYSYRFYATKYSKLMDGIQIDRFDSDDVFPDALYSVLKEKKNEYEKIVVIPCSDRYTQLLSRYYDRFEGMIANRFISTDLLDRLDTKDRFYSLCDEYGLDYPKTVIAPFREWENAVKDSGFDFPVVLKPENSNGYDYIHCHFEGKKKVFFIYSAEEYADVIGKMTSSSFRGKLIVQEFIPGGDDCMRVMNCYSGNDGKVKFMSLGQPVLEEYSPYTIGNYVSIISRNDMKIYEKVEKFLNDIGYVGLSNFDMKYDRRTGRYLMFEINPRPGRSSYYVRGTGNNMMKILCADILGEDSGEEKYASAGSLWTEAPKYVLTKYVGDKKLKDEIKGYYRAHKVSKTLFNPKDIDLRRELAIRRQYYSFIKSFRLYYFDKDKTKG